jgi:hypothetical protein
VDEQNTEKRNYAKVVGFVSLDRTSVKTLFPFLGMLTAVSAGEG